MSQKWNLQDIRPPEPRKTKRPSSESTTADGDLVLNNQGRPSKTRSVPKDSIPSIDIQDGTKKDSKKLLVSIVLFVLIVGGAIGLSALTGKTELTVYPKFKQPNINAEFTAYPDKREGELSYEIMQLESTSEAQVKATGQVEIEEQAKGAIEIIKTTPGAERLIKNTRFRTKDGLIFRIKESVVVPGAIKDDNGDYIPGTIQAEVFADEVGEDYNLPSGTTFDIPGFEENGYTALYQAITARNPQPFSGGFKGPQFQIDETELSTAKQKLQVELRDTLLARIDGEKPAGFVAFKDAVAITYTDLPSVQYGDDLVTIKENAVLQIPLFKETDLGSYLAAQAVPTYDGGEVKIDDPNVLGFTYSSATTSSTVIGNEPSLTFKLIGKPLLIWVFDEDKLKKDLAGLPKTAVNNIIPAYPALTGASVKITPFWSRTFPEDPDDIILKTELKDK